MAAFTRQAAAGHREGRRAAGGVAGHGLIDHNGIEERGVAVALGVVGGEVAVRQRDGIETLDAHALGEIGNELRVRDGDIRSGINRRGAEPVGGIRAAVHGDGTAAPVGADGRGGLAAGCDGQVIRLRHAAAGGHDAAGAAAGCGDGGVPDDQRGAVAGFAVLPAVAAVTKHAVCARSVGLDRAAGDRGRRAVLYQHRGVLAVEVAVVAAVGIAGFGNGGIADRHVVGRADEQRALIRRRRGIGFARLGGCGGDLRCAVIGHAAAAAAGTSAGRISAGAAFGGIAGRIPVGRCSAGAAFGRFAGFFAVRGLSFRRRGGIVVRFCCLGGFGFGCGFFSDRSAAGRKAH